MFVHASKPTRNKKYYYILLLCDVYKITSTKFKNIISNFSRLKKKYCRK